MHLDNRNASTTILDPPAVIKHEHVQQASTQNVDLQAENERLEAENHGLRVTNDKLRKENQKIRQELIALKRMYDSTEHNYVQKLLKMKIREQNFSPDVGQFGRFESVFGVEIIERLRALDHSKKRDSSFILECMRKLCSDDAQLKHVTACGRKGKLQKSNFSEEKRKILDDIFIERLATAQADEIETNDRYFRLNELINNAINNIVRVSRERMCVIFGVQADFISLLLG